MEVVGDSLVCPMCGATMDEVFLNGVPFTAKTADELLNEVAFLRFRQQFEGTVS
jgi:hypothetical protein